MEEPRLDLSLKQLDGLRDSRPIPFQGFKRPTFSSTMKKRRLPGSKGLEKNDLSGLAPLNQHPSSIEKTEDVEGV